MSKFQVYIIKNDINDKVYIGQTTQSLSARFNGHYGHVESRIGRAMKDMGKHHFSISLLDDTATNLEELLEKERYYIKNITLSKMGTIQPYKRLVEKYHPENHMSHILITKYMIC